MPPPPSNPIAALGDLRTFVNRRRLVLEVAEELTDAKTPPLRIARLDLADAADDREFVRRLAAALLLHDGRTGCPVTVRGAVHELQWRAEPGAVYLTLTPAGARTAFDIGNGEYPPTFPKLAARIAEFWLAGPGTEAFLPDVLYRPGPFPECPFGWNDPQLGTDPDPAGAAIRATRELTDELLHGASE
ncbi:hypothetical protein [Alienimonas californiensis]|uniref:Uncharacterized protein n=1 Tax=Alienimonas californiensis TaxID=2527989 RepID=A0A517P6P0_9PLAN|nr:hypothetical protein [Alienimonas californiensis]QDT15039.1 hypothetical protein CA12_11190 [Alienimonas californiensis]